MVGQSILVVMVALFAVASAGEWWEAAQYAKDCKDQEMGGTYDPKKLGCMMGCLGKNEKWLKGNNEIDTDKFNQWIDTIASKTGMADDLKVKWKNGGKSCATAAADAKNNCEIGDKIGVCLKNLGLL